MDKDKTPNIEEVRQPSAKTTEEALKLVKNALNKACANGSFSLDEAYVIKIAVDTLEKSLVKSS